MAKKEKHKTALQIKDGIIPLSPVNLSAVEKIKSVRKKTDDPDVFIKGILSGNRTILSKAITLVESSLESHKVTARKVVDGCLPHSGSSIRIGITGVPGAGKSSFIESFGSFLTKRNHKVAVLAIDPSSTRSRGSILGDKTRMERLSTNENAFIRPSPSGGSLGGVARKTREAVILCEAAGFDVIIIETVGVGQSETAVHSMTDIFLLLILTGAGDELQGIKRGIMEMADLLVINKVDGDNVEKANRTRAEFQNALHLFSFPSSEWSPKILLSSAVTGLGIPEIYDSVLEYKKLTQTNNYFFEKRAIQAKYWMHETITERLTGNFFGNSSMLALLKEMEKKVIENSISPFTAATYLLEKYFSKKK